MEINIPYTLELHVVSKKNPKSKYNLPADCLQGTRTGEQYLRLTESVSHIIELADGVLEVHPWASDNEDGEVRS